MTTTIYEAANLPNTRIAVKANHPRSTGVTVETWVLNGVDSYRRTKSRRTARVEIERFLSDIEAREIIFDSDGRRVGK